MTVVAPPAIDIRLHCRRIALDFAILTSRRPGESLGRPTLRVCPAGLRVCPICQGPGRSYAPIHGRSSPPVNSVLVVAAAGARPPAVELTRPDHDPHSLLAIINYLRGTDMAARRTAKARTVTVNLNRSADVQQAPSSIHEGGKASFTRPEQGCRGWRLRILTAQPGMAGRHRRFRSDARTIKRPRPRACRGRCGA